MFDHIFENRDKKITNLIRLGDFLGRSLRENVILFSIDDTNSRVSYITESKKLVTGEFDTKKAVSLDFIVVEDFDVYQNEEKFDNFVNEKVSSFMESLYSDDFAEAQTSFSDILETWTHRLKFDEVKRKLHEKNSKFNQSQDIMSTSEFQNFIEISETLAQYLKEHKETILSVPEIINGVKLSNSVAKAFDQPRLNYDTLQESGYFRVTDNDDKNIYEMICRQELVKKELLESKKEFNNSWASNKNLKLLAGMIYESDENKVLNTLDETLGEIPYFAFVSKRDIYNSIKNTLSISESVEIPDQHIKKYASKLFEFKKPVKENLINILNEKYGINIQNLKDPPTFKSLINTQVVVLESLARVSPKNSVQKQVLREFAKLLQTKSGVQSIDVNDCLGLIFEAAGYSELFSENELINQWDDALGANVEDDSFPEYSVDTDDSEETNLEEEEEGETEEEQPPQKPDPMEEDPDKEDEEEEEEDPDKVEKEISQDKFNEAMRELEDILGDISPEGQSSDDEAND